MSRKQEANTSANGSLDITTMFGIPVLSTEDPQLYADLYAGLVKDYSPRNLMQKLLLADLVHYTWEMARCRKNKTLLIQRRFFRQREREVQQARNKQGGGDAATEKEERPRTELQRAFSLVDTVDASVTEVDAIANREPDDLDHAHALEAGIDHYRLLDDLHHRAFLCRNEVLRQLELCEEGLSRRLRQASDILLDRHCGESPTQTAHSDAPLAPAAGAHE